MRPPWQRQAACRGRGTEWWFADKGDAVGAAKAVCVGCPVRRDCLAFALSDSTLVGIWAGDGRARAASDETSERVAHFGVGPIRAYSEPT